MSSSWGWMFGGGQAASKAKSNDTAKKAILELRTTHDMLLKRERHLEGEMAKQDELARKHVATNKMAAKTALRRKKVFETQLEQTQNQMMSLESQISSIESANINRVTLDAIKTAHGAMKGINKDWTIDKLDATMEELQEQHEITKEISNAIASATPMDALDESELEAEFAELQQEEFDKKISESSSAPISNHGLSLPTAARGELTSNRRVAEEDDEEAELRKLQAEMAM